jgi:hypothetical protein
MEGNKVVLFSAKKTRISDFFQGSGIDQNTGKMFFFDREPVEFVVLLSWLIENDYISFDHLNPEAKNSICSVKQNIIEYYRGSDYYKRLMKSNGLRMTETNKPLYTLCIMKLVHELLERYNKVAGEYMKKRILEKKLKVFKRGRDISREILELF